MSEYTKGPLRIVPAASAKWDERGDYAIMDADNKIIGEAYRTVDNGITRDAEANARLWAAAPDLHEALRAIQAGFVDGSIRFTNKRQSDSDPYHPANILMTAAIAKATEGEAGQ